MLLPAHAKLNLALAVGPPQPPRGFHPICSWFVALDLSDTVMIEPLPPGAPSRHHLAWDTNLERFPRPSPIDWPIEQDLAVRAHRLLEHHAGRELPLRMSITKRIPIGGGLGGGSSDAAAALRAINHLSELGLTTTQLRQLSAPLGSDIAFFIDDASQSASHTPRPAIVSGFGDAIDRIQPPPPAAELILIFPPFGCHTAAVYQAFDREIATKGEDACCSDPQRIDNLIEQAHETQTIPAADLFNDLFEPACLVQPALRELFAGLHTAARQRNAHIHLTGSGSTLFCIVPQGVESAELASTLRAAAHGSVIAVSQLC